MRFVVFDSVPFFRPIFQLIIRPIVRLAIAYGGFLLTLPTVKFNRSPYADIEGAALVYSADTALDANLLLLRQPLALLFALARHGLHPLLVCHGGHPSTMVKTRPR